MFILPSGTPATRYQYVLALADRMTPVEALDSFDSGSDTQRAVDHDGQAGSSPVGEPNILVKPLLAVAL